MRVSVQPVDEDNVDKPATDGGVYLGKAETTDFWSARRCLEIVSTGGNGPRVGRWKGGSYHHGHGMYNAGELSGSTSSRCIYKGMK